VLLLCCAVLCCAVLCCAVLCCAVLCCAVLCCAECLLKACSLGAPTSSTSQPPPPTHYPPITTVAGCGGSPQGAPAACDGELGVLDNLEGLRACLVVLAFLLSNCLPAAVWCLPAAVKYLPSTQSSSPFHHMCETIHPSIHQHS